jgi:hypothetical protein
VTMELRESNQVFKSLCGHLNRASPFLQQLKKLGIGLKDLYHKLLKIKTVLIKDSLLRVQILENRLFHRFRKLGPLII